MTTRRTLDQRIDTRVEVLEHGLDALKSQVESGFDKINKAVSRLSDVVSQHRPAASFKELAITASATVAVVTALFWFLDGRYERVGSGNTQAALLEQRVERVEKTLGVTLHLLPSMRGARQPQ